MRPGTEAVPNIAAFAKACEIRMAHFDEDYAHVQELADYLKQQVSAELVKAGRNHDFSLLCGTFFAAGETDKSVLKKLKKLSKRAQIPERQARLVVHPSGGRGS